MLRSINWSHVRFDVLCIETEEVNRPPGYASRITAYLAEKGYVNSTAQIGRNTCRLCCIVLTLQGADLEYNYCTTLLRRFCPISSIT